MVALSLVLAVTALPLLSLPGAISCCQPFPNSCWDEPGMSQDSPWPWDLVSRCCSGLVPVNVTVVVVPVHATGLGLLGACAPSSNPPLLTNHLRAKLVINSSPSSLGELARPALAAHLWVTCPTMSQATTSMAHRDCHQGRDPQQRDVRMCPPHICSCKHIPGLTPG